MKLPGMGLLGLLIVAAAAHAQTPLTIVNTSFTPGNTGSSYSVALQATGGTTPYTWSVTGSLPPGLVLNSAGSITGTPTASGTFPFTLVVIDSSKTSASRTVSIIITGSSARVSITTVSPLPAGTVGQPYSQGLTANGGALPYQWTAGQGLPAGFSLGAATGTIGGTPTAAGTFSFQVQVTDNAGVSASSTFSLTINPRALVITTVAPLFTGTVGVAYAQTFAASGGKTPYTWALTSGSIGGLTLDPNTGVLQGTPQSAGTFTLTVQVTDSAAVTASSSFSLVVNAATLAIVVSGQPVSGKVGDPYSQKLPVTANGGTAPITWSLASGSVPGLNFDPAPALNGTPTTAGTFDLVVQASDSAGLTARRSLTIIIAPAELTLTTPLQLPDVALNSVYSLTLTATGGRPPYTWSATGLPGGLTLNPSLGLISGTASTPGNFAVAITVTDSALSRAVDRFTLNVILPATPSFTLSGLPRTVPPARQFALDLTVATPYPAPITGQAILTFSPDSGTTDRTVVFASGGTTVNFSVAAGSTTVLPDAPLAIQTGTVSGTIAISLRLQTGGVDITPNPAPAITAQLNRAAPVIGSVQFTRSSGAINVAITGYATSREVTQATFTFAAASGQTLQATASSITVDVGTLFNTWYQSSNNSQYGSQFVLTQPFTIQGDANAVTPTTVTLANREGSVTFNIP
jgi:Putative Ig domain